MTPATNPNSKPRVPALPDGWLEIGKIVSTQGLRGEVRVYPSSDFPERFLEPGVRWLLRPGASQPEEIQLAGGRFLDGKGLYVVRFTGVETITAAEALRDCRLLVPESDRPSLQDDEYHVVDLIGLTVILQATQSVLGEVKDVLPAGNDLLEVKLIEPKGKTTTVLIPFVKEIVPIVDLTTRRIEIAPPAGLLDL